MPNPGWKRDLRRYGPVLMAVWLPVGLILMGFASPVAAGDTAPIQLTVAPEASGSAMTLTWSRPGSGHTGQVAWDVYRGVGSDDIAPYVTLPASTRSFVDPDVAASGSYYYAVRARNGDGLGPFSPVVWERAPDPQRPEVFDERFDDGGLAWTLGGLWGVSGSCVDVVDVPRHLSYHVAGKPCTFGSGVISAGRATSGLVDLADVRDATLLFEQHRDVEASGRVDHDVMEVRVEAGDQSTLLARYDAASPGGQRWESVAVDLSAYAGQQVRLVFAFDTVDVVDNAGAGWNLDGIAIRGTPRSAPGAVDDLVAESGPGEGEVRLTWSDPVEDGGSPITGFEILRGAAPDALAPHAQVPVGNGTNAFVDSGLAAGVVYYYAVQASNAYGTGPASNVAFGSAFTRGAPPQPLPYATTLTSAVYDGDAAYVFSGLTAPEGGQSQDSIVRFDPETGGSHVVNVTLPSPRHATSAAWVPGGDAPGRAYIFFGETHTNETSGESIETMSCHPSCLASTQILEFIPSTSQMSVVPVDVDLEGRHSTSSAYVPPRFDPDGAALPGTDMVWAFAGASAASSDGMSLQSCHPSCMVGTQIIGFDPSTDQVLVTSFSDPAIAPRSGTSAAYVPVQYDDGVQVPGTGLVYVFGGVAGDTEEHRGDDVSLSSCHPSCLVGTQIISFDPVTQQSLLMSATLPVDTAYASAVFDGAYVYLFGGKSHDGITDVVQRFDPLTGTVDIVSHLEEPEGGTSAVWTPFGMYVFGGDDGNDTTDRVERFEARAPQDTQAVPGSGNITVTWRPPVDGGASEVTGYRVYAGRSGDALMRISEVDASDPVFVLDADPATGAPLGEAETWSFKVSAVTATSEGPQGDLVTATTFARPSAPRDLTARNDLVADAIVLEWLPPLLDGGTPVTGYLVQRDNRPLGAVDVLDVGLVTTYTDHDCIPGTICTYRVAAYNIVGRSAFSDPAASGIGTPP